MPHVRSVVSNEMLKLLLVLATAACIKAELLAIDGEKATIEQLPYQASVENLGKFLCYGVIITTRNVLTTNKKMARWPDGGFHVRVGSADEEDGQLIKVSSYTFHDHEIKPNGDLVLIYLAKPIIFGPTIQPIPLVPEGQEPQNGEILTALQWSATQDGSTAESHHLIKMCLPIIDLSLCRLAYDTDKKLIKSHFLCAGGGHTSTILDNEFGGFLINAKNQLVGIVAWGVTKPGYPGVFSSIANPMVQNFIRYYSPNVNKQR